MLTCPVLPRWPDVAGIYWAGEHFDQRVLVVGRLRTLLVTNDFPPKAGGIQSYLYELVSTLDSWEVRVLAPNYPEADEFDTEQPYEIFREPTSRLYPTPRLLRRICALSKGADVVQFGYALQSWVLAPAIRRKTGLPYVVFVHGAEVLFPLRAPGAARLLAWGTLDGAAKVIAVSDHTAAGIERLTKSRTTCTVMRPVVDVDKFRSSVRGRAVVRERHGLGDRPTMLCVSRLTPRKGQDRLVDVLPELHGRFGARLLLVGEGPLENRLRTRARKLGAERQVVFAGRVPDEALPDYYAAADVFAMPVRSRWAGLEEEGFGVVFVEAAAAGLPAVVGGSGGTGEAVEDGKTGYLVDGRSRPEIQRSLSRLLEDEGLRKRMGAAARERAKTLHGADAVGLQYREVLERAARRRAPS